jgi:hypothetical protein
MPIREGHQPERAHAVCRSYLASAATAGVPSEQMHARTVMRVRCLQLLHDTLSGEVNFISCAEGFVHYRLR